jgi:hypothetical protein
MRLVLLLLGGPLAVLSLLAACGGEVTHLPGQGGSSASSSGTSMDASSATGNPASSGSGIVSSSSGVPATFCAEFCAKRAAFMCIDAADCPGNCPSQITGSCAPEVVAFFQCYADFATSCDLPPACEDELDLLDLCGSSGECGPVVCSGGGSGGQTSCECSTTCGMTTILASCQAFGSDGKCACSINGSLVGECEEQSPTCGVFDGCCSQFF